MFRLSAEMDHQVDPQLLQGALDVTFDQYPLYRAVLRRGVFWYYLQDSDLRPLVTTEKLPTCAALYWPDRRTLLFRVVHHDRRIILEVFHALSDGAGGSWFLSDLVSAYVQLQQRGAIKPDSARVQRSGYPDSRPEGSANVHPDSHPSRHAAGDGVGGAGRRDPARELVADSFAQYFRHRRRQPPTADAEFGRVAVPAVLTVAQPAGSTSETIPPSVVASAGGGRSRRHQTRAFRVRGTRTPDLRTRAVELTVPTGQVLDLARAERVPLTMYLTGLFFEAIRRSAPTFGAPETVAASVPVNLRQFFPSTSPRNFFATVRVAHTYGANNHEADLLGSVCRDLDRQFRPQASKEVLAEKLRRFLWLERMPLLRVVPRPVKDVLLNLANRRSNQGLTVAVSNLGRISIPGPADAHVGRMLFHVCAVRPQLSIISHADLLTLTFTSPFVETGHIREFVRLLTGSGVQVRVAATQVTEAELADPTETDRGQVP